MRSKDPKTKSTRRTISKCKNQFIAYDKIQNAYGDVLERRDDIVEFQCNVLLDELGEDKDYCSDFVCKKADGELMVRECIFRRNLTRPKYAHLLNLSFHYWLNRGVEDWGIVIEEEESGV